MFKKVPRSRRCSQPVMVNTTISLRAAVEKLAKQNSVSLAEIGRRALTEFVAKNTEERVEP